MDLSMFIACPKIRLTDQLVTFARRAVCSSVHSLSMPPLSRLWLAIFYRRWIVVSLRVVGAFSLHVAFSPKPSPCTEIRLTDQLVTFAPRAVCSSVHFLSMPPLTRLSLVVFSCRHWIVASLRIVDASSLHVAFCPANLKIIAIPQYVYAQS